MPGENQSGADKLNYKLILKYKSASRALKSDFPIFRKK
jgi:hypothetical protein